MRINEPSESLPSLYFSLASALSLASKYQTVMAYLRDKEDKKNVRLQMISFVNQKSLFIYNDYDIQIQGYIFKIKDQIFHFSPWTGLTGHLALKSKVLCQLFLKSAGQWSNKLYLKKSKAALTQW